MRYTTVIVSVLVFIAAVLLINLDKYSTAKGKTKLVSITINANDFTGAEKNKIKNRIQEILTRNGNVRIVTQGKRDKTITGLAIKSGNLKAITLTMKDTETGDTTEASSSCNCDFNKFLNTSVTEVAEKILQRI